MRRYLIVALALLGGGLQAAEHPNAPQPVHDEFNFVVLGDAQFDAPEAFNRIIDQTRRLRPAFVIQVGDLIDGYNSDLAAIQAEWDRYKKQIAPLAPIAFLPVPGNHDVYNGDKQPDQALTDLFNQHWGASRWSFTYKNTLLVGLNSDAPGAINQIAGTQWQWLVETLSTSTATHKMVFMHRPPWLMANADDIHELFKRQGVSHAIYGHHHHFHHSQRDQVNYTMTNAAGDSVHHRQEIGGMPHLLHVSVRGEEVDVAAIVADAILPIDAVKPEDNYDYFNLSRGLAPRQIKLQPQDSYQFVMDLPLANTSERDIQVFISCFSADNRWSFTPTRLEVVNLAPRAQHTVTLRAHFDDQRQPESEPKCQLRIPFQTATGQWLELRHQVTGTR